MRRMLVAITAIAAVGVMGAGTALAAGQQLCVPGGASKAVVTLNAKGACNSGYTEVTLATQQEVTALQGQVQALQTTLSKVQYHASGLNGKPTLEISGANLQVDSGLGSTNGGNDQLYGPGYTSVNGLGNVFIGYDENDSGVNQTGSNNLILGEDQDFTSFGGIIAGAANTLTGPFGAVFGEQNSVVSGAEASVTGGVANVASGNNSAVLGGYNNTASGAASSILGGYQNTASGRCQSIPATTTC